MSIPLPDLSGEGERDTDLKGLRETYQEPATDNDAATSAIHQRYSSLQNHKSEPEIGLVYENQGIETQSYSLDKLICYR